MPFPLKPIVPLAILAVSLAGIGIFHNRSGDADESALRQQVLGLQSQRLTDLSEAEIARVSAFLGAESVRTDLRSAFSAPSASALLDELADAGKAFQVGAVGIHDKTRNLLHSAGAPSRSGDFYGFDKLIRSAYEQAHAMVQAGEYRGKPALMFAQPIRDGGNIRGLLLAARYIDQDLADSLSLALGLPVQITINGQTLSAGAGGGTLVPAKLANGLAANFSLALRLPEARDNTSDWPLLSAALLLGGLGAVLGWLSLRDQSLREQKLAQLSAEVVDSKTRAQALVELAAETSGDGLGQIAGHLNQAISALSEEIAALEQALHNHEREREQLKTEIRQVTKARDDALRAPRTKSEFLSRMGDEITTPMHSVVSMLDLLRQYDLPTEPKELVNIADRSAHTLVENLTNIMDFSKLDAGMLKLHMENFAIAPLVEDVVSQLRPHARDKGLRLESNIAEGVPVQASGDPVRIRQILSNLVGNAIRFTRDGEVAVYVDILQPAEDRYLRFSVVDTGVGIPKDAQAGLFDSLDQRSKLTNSSFAGRLRLIVAKELTTLMGGQIGVSSEVGKGSRFWFTVKLPR